jgi:hypothetical protein
MVDILINDTTRTTPMVNLNLPNIDITMTEAYEDQGDLHTQIRYTHIIFYL